MLCPAPPCLLAAEPMRMSLRSQRHKIAGEQGPGESEVLTPLKVDPKASPADKGATLLEASRRGDQETLNRLLEVGADPNYLDPDGWTPLMAAALGDRPDSIARLLQVGAQVDLAAAPRGRTALMEAAWQKHPRALQALLEGGADPDRIDSIGGVAIAHTDCCDCILLLAQAGANLQVQRQSTSWPSLMEFAASKGRIKLMKELLTRGASLEPGALTAAAAQGQLRAAGWLLQQGADINGANSRGETPLMGAAGSKPGSALPLVEDLLARGADPGRIDQSGGSALHYAIRAGQPQVLLRLLPLHEPQGEPLLHYAAALDRSACVKVLLSQPDPKVNYPFRQQTPLMRALERGLSNSLELLLEAGADLEARNEEGCTPLSLALRRGRPRVVERLLEAGADREARDQQGRTPLMEAAASAAGIRSVEALLAAGADPQARDTRGNSALLAALLGASEQHLRVARSLLRAGSRPTGELVRFCQQAIWHRPDKHRDRCRTQAIRLLVECGEEPHLPEVLAYAKIHRSRGLQQFLKGCGVSSQQIESAPVPDGVGHDWR